MIRSSWRWRWLVEIKTGDVRENLTPFALTVAYQGATPHAWRGLMLTILSVTFHVGVAYREA